MSLERRDLVAGAIILAALVGWFVLLAPAFFRVDDYTYLGEIDALHPSLGSWLNTVYYRHWAPGHRLAFWLMGGATTAAWRGIVLFQVAVLGAGLLAYYRALVLLFGNTWWLLVPLASLACCTRFAFPLLWPSAGLQVVPAFASATVAVYGLLRWQRDGRLRWTVLASAATAFGLLFYVRPMLTIGLLLSIRILFLCPSLHPRAVWRDLWRERLGWLVLLVVPVAYAVHYLTLDALGATSPFTATAFQETVRLGWLRNIGPGLLGLRLGPDALTTPQKLVEVLAQAALLAAFAWSLARHGWDALRGWAFVVIAVLATFALTAEGRLADLGPTIGLDARYTADLFWLVPLGIMVALAPHRPLQREPRPRPTWMPVPAATGLVLSGLAVVVVGAVTAAAWTTSVDERTDWKGVQARQYVDRLRADAEAIERRTGRPPAVQGGYAADLLIPSAFGYYADAARVIHTLRAPVLVNPPSGVNAALRPDGSIVAGRLVAGPRIPLTAPPAGAQVSTTGPVQRQGDALCAAPGGVIQVVPSAPFTPGGLVTVGLLVSGTIPRDGLGVAVDSGYGWPGTPQRFVADAPGGRTATETGETSVAGIRLVAPPTGPVCIRELRFGGVITPPA